MHFGNWLKTKRTLLHISLRELSEVSGCSKNYLSVIERNIPHHRTGCLPNPSNAVFKGIAHGLGLPIQEVRNAWAILGNGSQGGKETLLPEQDPQLEQLKALYTDMEETDREEIMAYAQFRAIRRDPQSASVLAAFLSSGDLAGAGGSSLRVDMVSGSVYTVEGQRVTDRKELLEAAAMIKAQVTLLEIETSQGKETS